MSLIAKKTKIAVGTLYNYYPDKKNLFISVLKKSWNITFSKIEKIENSNISSQEKIENIIKILFSDICNRKGLGGELIHEFPKDTSEVFLSLRSKLNKKIRVLILEIYKKNINKEYLDILENSFVEYILILIHKYPNDQKKCIKYMIDLIKNLSVKSNN